MPKVRRRSDSTNDLSKVNLNFDVPMVETLIKYMMCESVPSMNQSNLNNLMKQLNLDQYNYSPDIQLRLKLVKLICEAKVENNIHDPNLIITYVHEHNKEIQDISNDIDFRINQLNESECKYVSKAINERLQYMYVFQIKDQMMDLYEKIDQGGFNSYYDIMSQLKILTGQLLMKLRQADASEGLLKSFDFSGQEYAHLMNIIVNKAKRPSSVLMTGIRQLNAILSPGFQSGRLYTILGGTGKFKSGTLLNIADQIRLYNPQIVPFENGMRKTVLFITCENSIEETIARLYDMYTDDEDDIKKHTTEEVIETLRKNGKFNFTDNSGIDIDFKYYANLEINTGDIYGLIQEMTDQGKRPIALVLDYISRINSVADNGGDERIRLSFVAKELKSLAQYFEIPVITAMQLNREGNSIIDAALRENKQDVASFVGASNIGISWSILEESDWACLINPEMQKSSGKLFLTFKRLKIRGKKDPFAFSYFNHPFVNSKNIRLMPDTDLEKPVSIMSLANDLETADEKELDKRANKRPDLYSSNKNDGSILDSIGISSMVSGEVIRDSREILPKENVVNPAIQI